MKSPTTLIFLLTIIVISSSCPDGCQTCNADPAKCQVCQAGYELNESTQLCDLSYSLQAEWSSVCTTGTRQSPINIITSSNDICPSGAHFKQITSTTQTDITPEGENLKASFSSQSTVTYERSGVTSTFNSLQFHWHHPSEHQINGQYMDLELHVVHSKSDGSGNLAVTGLLFKVDKEMKSDLFDHYNFIPDSSSHPFIFPITMKNRLIFHYEGSLTTPPCSEIVSWFVYTEYFPITQTNFDKIAAAINSGHNNARDVQNINGRTMQIFGGFCNSIFF